jgi:2-keto-3-deoxy-L-rhamnonate aldolase RhmA
MKQPLKARLRSRDPVFGSFAFLPSPDVVEIMGAAGFDYVIIDLEHSPKNWGDVANMIRAAELHSMAPLIRVRENNEKTILEALELGAEGIVVPFVQTAADVKLAARAMNYPPAGMRGTCTLTRAAQYGGLRGDFIRHTLQQNERLVLVAQIEDKQGVENIDAILACDPGIDVVLVGRSDLASSLGCPGQVEDPAVLAATQKVMDAAKRQTGRVIPSGIGLYAPHEAANWLEKGCGFFFYSADTAMLLHAASEAAGAFRRAMRDRSQAA